MISLNICVLFTVICCIISVQPRPHVSSFGEIPCNFSWTDEIKKIHPLCDVESPHYVSNDLYLCAGLLKKSLDLCLLLKNLSATDVINRKPIIDNYDSNVCIRFKDFAINPPNTNWISVYNNLFSSNSSCLSMCIDIRDKVNPLCQYTMWVTDEFNDIRNKSVNEGVHSKAYKAPVDLINSVIKTNSMHSNKVDVVLTPQKTKLTQMLIQTSDNNTDLLKHGKSTSNENTTRSIILNKNSLISQISGSNSTSEPSVILVSASTTQTNSKMTTISLPIKYELSAKQDQSVDIQRAHSPSIINEIKKVTSYASTTVRTTTKQNNPSDSVLEKSEVMNNVPPKISTSKTMISDNVDEATGNEIDNTAEFTDQDDDLDETEVKEPSADGAPSATFNRIETMGPAHEENEIDTDSTVDQFMKPDDSHFFAYFMTMMVLCIIGYLVFHNKQKILALALEGRSRRSRRRPNTSGYRKLDSNLEEAITSTRSSSATNVIY